MSNSNDDLISRQAAVDEIKEIYEWHDNVTEERIIDHLKRLPSAQPEPERTMEEFMYGQDMGNPEDGSL